MDRELYLAVQCKHSRLRAVLKSMWAVV
eukprot:COSAG01_NODE_30048_length_624_cov_0.792381_1_plen_27_part_10